MGEQWSLSLLLLCAALACGAAARGGEDADYFRARQLYTLQEYKLAADALTQYLAKFPKSERAGEARLLLAESFYQLREYAQAAQHFERFLTAAPAAARRAEALQRAVKSQYLCREYEKGLAHAAAFLKENRPRLGQPDAPPALGALFESVLYYAGECAYALKKPDVARAHWENLRRDFPQSKLIPDAAEGLGWIAFDAGRFDEARACFALTAGTPAHAKAASSQVLLARTLEKLSRPDEALAALEQVANLSGGKEQAREVAFYRAMFLLHAKR